MPPWFLLRCNAPVQNHLLDYLRQHNPDAHLYFPLFPKISRPHGCRRPITIHLPVFPGYLFLRPFIPLRATTFPSRARAHYVRFNGSGIATVPDAVIAGLRHRESLNQLVIEKIVENPYRPGTRVRVYTPVADEVVDANTQIAVASRTSAFLCPPPRSA
jgi:hypothetical protein